MPMAIPLVVAVGLGTSWVAIAGAALALVGTLTNNKTLTMIGGLVGLAGGFAAGAGAAGGAFEGAAATGEVASAAGEAAGSSVAGEAAQGALAGADTAGQTLDAANNTAQLGGATAQGATASPLIDSQIPGASPPTSPAEVAQVSSSPAAQSLGPQPADTSPLGAQIGAGGDPLADPFVDSGGLPGQNIGSTGSLVPGQSKGLVDMVQDFFKGDTAKGALIKTGGEFLAKGFGRNPAAEAVDVSKARLAAEQAELARINANKNNIAQLKLNQQLNPNANLYGAQNQYAPVGLINRRIA